MDVARLDEKKQRHLLALARTSIASAFGGGEARPPAEDVPGSEYPEDFGAFVSLHEEGELRGCIGMLTGGERLDRLVERMARAAAFEDHRFPPLGRGELDRCQIEISVLSPMRPGSAEEVEVGRHGIVISHGWNRGVLLPQVASERGWSREQFLEATCRKAGLGANAWKDPETTIELFEAQVFGEGHGS